MKRIRINPTLRKNGLMMFTIKVEFTVSIEQLTSIGTMKALNEEKLPETRPEWLELLANGLHENGIFATPEYISDYPSDTANIDEAKSLVDARLQSLFPDLQPPKGA